MCYMNLFMFCANLFCAATVGLYYLIGKDSLIFNVIGVLWAVMIISNMICGSSVKNRELISRFALIAPVLLIFLKGQLTNLPSGGAYITAIVLHVLAIVYFVLSAFLCRKAGTFSPASEGEPAALRRPGLAGWIIYIIFMAIITAVFLSLLYYTIVYSSLSMSAPVVQMVSGFRLFFTVFAFALGLGLVRRLTICQQIAPARIVMGIVCCLFVIALLPEFAVPGTAVNANKAYERFLGEDGFKVSISVPQELFGSTEKGYSVTSDITYATMNYEGQDYELKFDMYQSDTNAADPAPVLIRMHGSGGHKGSRNNILMSESIAAAGYTVLDINYGNEDVKPSNEILAENVCSLLNYLYENKDQLNIDTDRIYLSGASRGGKMTLMAAAAWSSNRYFDIKNKVTIAGNIVLWGVMDDVFQREGDEKILSLEDLNSDFPTTLFIDTTNDGSVQGQHLMQGVLYSLGVSSANIEMRYAMHGANNDYYSFWGQLIDQYVIRFMSEE